MRSPLDAVELVEIIGENSMICEGFTEGMEGFDRIVDCAEKDRLVHDDDPLFLEKREVGENVGIELVGVVGVDDKPYLLRKCFEDI